MSEESQSKSAIATVTRGPGGLELRTFADVWSFSQCLVKSGMAPPELNTVEQVVIAIEMGAEIGVKAMQAVQGIAVINKKPCIYGDLMLGVCQASKVWDERVFAEWYTGTYPNDDFAAHCRVGRVGAESPVECTFSVADAKQAGLWGKSGPWTNYTKRQMMWRARTWACRNSFADVLKGLQVAEEVQDYAAVIDAPTQPSLPGPASRGDAIAALAAPATPAVGSLNVLGTGTMREEASPVQPVTGRPFVDPGELHPAPETPPVATQRSIAISPDEDGITVEVMPGPVETPPEPVATITPVQFNLLLKMYDAMDGYTKRTLRKQLDFPHIDDLKDLPDAQFDDVHRAFIDAHAASVPPDKPAKPEGTPRDDETRAILTGQQYADVKAGYDTCGNNLKQDFRAFTFGSSNTMFTDLKKRPSNKSYDQLMAWLKAQKE